MCFSYSTAKFLKTPILKKICARLLLNDVEQIFKVFSQIFLNIGRNTLVPECPFWQMYSQACNLSLSFFKRQAFSQQLSEIFNDNSFKEHCYKKKRIVIKKRGPDIYRNLITQLFIQLRQDFCISAQFIVAKGYYQSKKVH